MFSFFISPLYIWSAFFGIFCIFFSIHTYIHMYVRSAFVANFTYFCFCTYIWSTFFGTILFLCLSNCAAQRKLPVLFFAESGLISFFWQILFFCQMDYVKRAIDLKFH
jgi:hypothetical protein